MKQPKTLDSYIQELGAEPLDGSGFETQVPEDLPEGEEILAQESFVP